MDDKQIVDLYWARSEKAIEETEHKFGSYCRTVSYNILANTADAEECVNDTWLHTWNAIPPQRPSVLSSFLGRITRNLALHIFRREHAEKRGGGETALVFEELSECVSGRDRIEQAIDEKELQRAINDFLSALPVKKRKIFVRRYWYAESVAQIAARMDMTENRVSVILHRLRAALRSFLEERGFDV